jgi:hypothetical protein
MRNHYVSVAIRLLAGIVLMTAGAAYAAQPVKAGDMGLSMGSVFDTPTPKVYHYVTAQPCQSLHRSAQGAGKSHRESDQRAL